MKKIKIFVLVFSSILYGVGCSSSNTDSAAGNTTSEEVATDAATGATTTQPLDTTSFPVMAASSDMFEILGSQQAQQKATNAEVKRFAEQMITDHTQTSTELKSIAEAKNMLLPAAPLPMHQRMITAISTEDAKEFDEEYMEAQVLAHQQAVTLFETASTNEANPELKAFAAKHLPHLRMHLDMAKQVKDKVD